MENKTIEEAAHDVVEKLEPYEIAVRYLDTLKKYSKLLGEVYEKGENVALPEED